MRIEAKKLSDYSWFVRRLLAKQKHAHGEVLAPGFLWGRSPSVFAAVASLSRALDRNRSPIPPELRSLIAARVSQIISSPFCVDINRATLVERGVTRDKVEALADWRRNPLFDERERAVLDYAEAVTGRERKVDDALMDRLKQHFSDDEVVEITGLICFQNMSSKFNTALDVPSGGFCKLPAALGEAAAEPGSAAAPPGGDPAKKPGHVSRNAPCPCGSGKKYKHCHGRIV